LYLCMIMNGYCVPFETIVEISSDPLPLTAAVETPDTDVAWITAGAYFPNFPVTREALNLSGKLLDDKMDDSGMHFVIDINDYFIISLICCWSFFFVWKRL
jgi:hypothetical protein